MAGIASIREQCANLIVVTNEVFSDGAVFDEWTTQYLECLGSVNCAMARDADCVAEIVYGIPVILKQSEAVIL